jgi:hypothetical protein
MTERVSRRSFAKGAIATMSVALGATVAGCAGGNGNNGGQGQAQASKPFWIPEKWDREADIVVIGTGGGGLMAGLTASENGDEVLVIEKASEAHAGGNSRVCGQLLFTLTDVEAGIKYQKNLNGPYLVDDEALRGWAEALHELPELLRGYGAKLVEYNGINPEFVGVGGEGIVKIYYNEKVGNSSTWNFIKELVDDAGVEILYDTPGKKLIQDPQTREILGVVAGVEGSEITIKARKGVLLACGGFESNQKMIRDYLPQMPKAAPTGTPYNTGDGIVMAQEVGADLWHMNNVSGPSLGFVHPQKGFICGPIMATKKFITVNSAGKRFINEEQTTANKHGRIEINGGFQYLPTPLPVYQIFDDTNMDIMPIFGIPATSGTSWNAVVDGFKGSKGAVDEIAAGWVQAATSIEGLAEKIGIDPAALKKTVDAYNANAANNTDPDFGRGAPFEEVLSEEEIAAYDLVPLTGPNYYAVECCAALVNTQGGPRRNGKGQVIDLRGEPIPRLHSTGELGAIYSYLYQGGGNLAESIMFGRIGANELNKLPAWDA